jgi:putative oxidoreductase
VSYEDQIAIAILTVRLFVGILFFFQGYDKIFRVGVKRLVQTLNTGMANGSMNESILRPLAISSSWIEMISGFLLFVGFAKPIAMAALCFNLLVVSIGFSRFNPIWNESHVFVRLTSIIFLMMIPSSMDIYSLDYFINQYISP